MPSSKTPKRFSATDLDNSNIAAGAAIVTSKLADSGNFVMKDGSITMSGALNMGSNLITNVTTPSSSGDAANKSYVDNLIAALNQVVPGKDAARAASTANVTISNPATAVFDGVTLTSGNRLLLKNQTAPEENGIYIFTASGSALTRATDFDAWNEIPSTFVPVEEGTVNADTVWLSTANQGGTLGTTAITFIAFGVSTGYTTSNFVDQETPSGTVNGSNTSFTLANTPTAGSVHLWLEGWLLIPGAGNDYTISGSNITMLTAPLTGERLRASYRK